MSTKWMTNSSTLFMTLECLNMLDCAYESEHKHWQRCSNLFQEPEVQRVPFQGVGRTLGSSSATESSVETNVGAPLLSAPAPSEGLVVNQSQPSTSIQLRLADGTRMVAHFNHHHTVAHIRSFINASRPGGPTSYQLQTVGFPPKILTDLTQTIEQAGLLNSVVVQRL